MKTLTSFISTIFGTQLDLRKSFDLVWCFEVAEHIHPKFVDIFVNNLTRHSKVVALSAAPPGQGGEGHFNEQPKSYWEKKFADRGYALHAAWTCGDARNRRVLFGEHAGIYLSEMRICNGSPE